MPKNLLQDMLRVKRLGREAPMSPLKETEFDSSPNEEPQPLRPNKSRPRYTLWLVAIVSLLFFIFSVSYLLSKVTITVNPKTKDVALNENLSVGLEGAAEGLTFDLMVISGEEEKEIGATEERNVSEKARGVVLIYNAFSSASQRLDIETRLEGSNGKIYKTEKQIVVPGMKEGVPQSIEVRVFAAEAGEDYNSDPLDFTIVGFKGTPKYSKFYARSSGKITGGFEGKKQVIEEAKKLATIDDLKTTLQAKLFQKAKDQIPGEVVLFENAAFLEAEEDDLDFVEGGDGIMFLRLKGTLYGFIFNEDELTKKIAEKHLDEKENEDGVYISNIRDLSFSLLSKDNDSFDSVKNINFTLKGTAKIVSKLDENKLISGLLGKSRKDFNQILLQYPNIDSADLVIRPFWKRSFPDETKDIKVIVNYPE